MAQVVKNSRDGTWLARWRDPAGAQRKKSFKRKVDAERFLSELQTQMNRGTYIDPAAGKLRFAQFAETWMAGLGHLKPSTALRYREVARTHVIPQWGPWPLAKVARSDVAAWIGDLVSGGMSPGQVRKVYLVTSMIFEAAAADHRIGTNPAKGVRLPKQIRHDPRFLSPAELSRLVEAAGGHGLEVLVLGLTGIRFGEFAALKVKRVDPARNRLVIAESVTVVGSSLVWSTPKTHQTRSVPVPPVLMGYLVEACRGRGGEDLVFPSTKGGPLRLNNWRRRVFEPACAAARIQDFRVHDLRHTAASLAIAAGANVKAVQQMLGHASAAMTLDVYAGLFPDDLDAVGRSLDAHVPQMCHNGLTSGVERVALEGRNGT
ncbi:tyrosine-type recombinase/integrase [Mobilicoccus pelagius]|uniref:Putative transposase n=1 Tax=Mobilicoccus pelagius NBRC 104925 TaxID=1089455 RepID=H5USK5_9MICO|nr:site-specific integrase [Mobilicoccus pelagius]GAB48713.1 putative transposase [Mobilicoccus pelagius NBRC 104925]